MGSDITNVTLGVSHNALCQDLKDMHNFRNKYFPSSMIIWVNDPFKVQDRPMNFNVIDYE